MKKIILATMLVAGMFTVSNIQAQDGKQTAVADSTVAQQATAVADCFQTVQVDQLNAKVQEAMKNYVEMFSIQSVSYCPEKKQVKLELADKKDQSLKTVYLNEEGLEVSGK